MKRKIKRQEKMICREEARKYLDFAKSLSKSHQFFDMHVHPFEVVFSGCAYLSHPDQEGYYTTGKSSFSAPWLHDIVTEEKSDQVAFSASSQGMLIAKMRLSSLYSHTGSKVFEAHMALSGIDRILLLPVAPREGDVDAQMIAMEKMFTNREIFCFGWSVPNSLHDEQIFDSAKSAVNRFDISAIKIHPGQTEINLSTDPGKHRVNCILEVCRKLHLPLILHAGKYPLARIPQATDYSTINALKDLEWDISPFPVVFAHAAVFSCDLGEIEDQILPTLKKMLSRFENIFVDISQLDVHKLISTLNSIPIDRILFGSDALYDDQWKAIVKLLIALEKVSSRVEEDFLKIMVHNPANYIFKCSES
jgi:hypothetical protein